MTAQADLQAALAAADLPTDESLLGVGYFGGTVWVLADSYTRSVQPETLIVVCAVTMGEDIMGFVEQVWARLSDQIEGVSPQSYRVTYGGIPIPGRNMERADYAEIDVETGYTLPRLSTDDAIRAVE